MNRLGRIWLIESRIAGSRNPKQWIPTFAFRPVYANKKDAVHVVRQLNSASRSFEYRVAAYIREVQP